MTEFEEGQKMRYIGNDEYPCNTIVYFVFDDGSEIMPYMVTEEEGVTDPDDVSCLWVYAADLVPFEEVEPNA